MTNDYIRRDDALDALKAQADTMQTWVERYAEQRRGVLTAVNIVEDIEPADVAPVVHAYWIPQKENHEFKEVWMKCSACGYPVSKWTGNTNFCPNCGVKMDGGKNT